MSNIDLLKSAIDKLIEARHLAPDNPTSHLLTQKEIECLIAAARMAMNLERALNQP